MVAAADAGNALAAAPAAAVQPSPRLVQPTFASEETVFENEANDSIKTASVLSAHISLPIATQRRRALVG